MPFPSLGCQVIPPPLPPWVGVTYVPLPSLGCHVTTPPLPPGVRQVVFVLPVFSWADDPSGSERARQEAVARTANVLLARWGRGYRLEREKRRKTGETNNWGGGIQYNAPFEQVQ